MTNLPRITTLAWVPDFARGFVRDLRPRWAFEEVGQPYVVDLIRDCKAAAHRRFQPFGQVPTYRDDEVEIFESGAMVLRIAERAGKLIPSDPSGRMKAIQWIFAALNTIELRVMEFTINEKFEEDRAWSAERRPVVLGYIDERLRDLEAYLGDRQWLEGDAFTIGDLTMISLALPLTSLAARPVPPTKKPWPTISPYSIPLTGFRRSAIPPSNKKHIGKWGACPAWLDRGCKTERAEFGRDLLNRPRIHLGAGMRPDRAEHGFQGLGKQATRAGCGVGGADDQGAAGGVGGVLE
jgi:glutathione S-transferase